MALLSNWSAGGLEHQRSIGPGSDSPAVLDGALAPKRTVQIKWPALTLPQFSISQMSPFRQRILYHASLRHFSRDGCRR